MPIVGVNVGSSDKGIRESSLVCVAVCATLFLVNIALYYYYHPLSSIHACLTNTAHFMATSCPLHVQEVYKIVGEDVHKLVGAKKVLP
jgi:hypothetical protein